MLLSMCRASSETFCVCSKICYFSAAPSVPIGVIVQSSLVETFLRITGVDKPHRPKSLWGCLQGYKFFIDFMTVKTSNWLLMKHLCAFLFQAFFGALFDGDKEETMNISSPVQARYVQFNPQEPLNPDDNNLCLRVDIVTCQNGNYTSSKTLYQDKSGRKRHTVFNDFGTYSLKLSSRCDLQLAPNRVYIECNNNGTVIIRGHERDC